MGTITTAQTNAESRAKAHAARTASREQRLRSHPHAEVLGPELVSCKLCGQLIKLSTKSMWDGFHWQKHIERCVRRAPAAREQRVIRAAERKKRSKIAKDDDQESEKRATLTIRLRTKGPAESSPNPSSASDSVQVKEETPERDIDIHAPSSSHSRSSPLPETPPPPSAVPPRPESNIVMEDYYRRSRRRGTRELSPFTLEAASAWTWSQVKEPVWVVASYPASESQDSENSPNAERGGEASRATLETYASDKWSKAPSSVAYTTREIGFSIRKDAS